MSEEWVVWRTFRDRGYLFTAYLPGEAGATAPRWRLTVEQDGVGLVEHLIEMEQEPRFWPADVDVANLLAVAEAQLAELP